jgi:hypothetical protein
MSLCILGLAHTLTISATVFSLSWTHSAEGTRWEETWRIADGELQVTEARVKGSGAGMEPAETAVLRGGWWVFRPNVPPQEKLLLAASGATQDGWLLCADGDCWSLGKSSGPTITVQTCEFQ